MHGVVDLLCCNACFHHHGCNVQDFSCQLQIVSHVKSTLQQTYERITTADESRRWILMVTLHTTLMPSMSSGERILICDVPFKNCSDSDIPAGRKQGQTTGITHTSILSETDELVQPGSCNSSCCQSINSRTVTAGFTSSWLILFFHHKWQPNKSSVTEKAQGIVIHTTVSHYIINWCNCNRQECKSLKILAVLLVLPSVVSTQLQQVTLNN